MAFSSYQVLDTSVFTVMALIMSTPESNVQVDYQILCFTHAAVACLIPCPHDSAKYLVDCM